MDYLYMATNAACNLMQHVDIGREGELRAELFETS
jgi:hypothetical protein